MTYEPPPPGNTPGYGGPPPGGSGIQQMRKGFFAALFDFGFNHFATLVFVRVLYVLGLIVITLAYLAFLIGAFAESLVLGFVVLLFGWIVALIYLAFLRMVLEFYYAVIRMSEDIHHRR